MIEYKILLGALAVAFQLLSYLIYFIGIWKGRTKPHAFTWFVWGFLNVVALPAVLSVGGGAGAWVLGVNVVACFTISGIGFWQKRVQYDLYDWLALIGGIVGVLFWWMTDNPMYAIVLVSLSDAVSLIPTFRKAYRLPFEENAGSFAIGLPGYLFSLLALETLTITTWLYPVVIIVIDATLVVLIITRRKKLK